MVDTLTPSDGGSLPVTLEFGNSMATDGSTIVVGTSYGKRTDGGPGRAYVFEKVGPGDWEETQILTASDGHKQDKFGAGEMAVDGDWITIGASNWNSTGVYNSSTESGKVYLFEVPEPGTLSLLAMGGLALALLRRRNLR